MSIAVRFMFFSISILSFFLQLPAAAASSELYWESYPSFGNFQDGWISRLHSWPNRTADYLLFRHGADGKFDNNFGDRGILRISQADPRFQSLDKDFTSDLILLDIFNNRAQNSLILAFTLNYSSPRMPRYLWKTDLLLIKFDAQGHKHDEQFGEGGFVRLELGSPRIQVPPMKILAKNEPGRPNAGYYIAIMDGLNSMSQAHHGQIFSLDARGQLMKDFANEGTLLLSKDNTLDLLLQHPQIGANQELLFDGNKIIERRPDGSLTRQFHSLAINPRGEISTWNFGTIHQKHERGFHQFFLDRQDRYVYFDYYSAESRDHAANKRTIGRILPGSNTPDPHFKPFTFDYPPDPTITFNDVAWDATRNGRRFLIHRTRFDDDQTQQPYYTAELIELDDHGRLDEDKSKLVRLQLEPCAHILTTQ